MDGDAPPTYLIRLTSYWAVPITTSEQALLSVNLLTLTAWRCSDRFDGMAAKFRLDRVTLTGPITNYSADHKDVSHIHHV